MSLNYIYLLIEREFINSGENVYKIGRTTQQNDARFRQYPKGSVLLFQSICSECCSIEKKILTIFCKEFKQRKDIGIEYFEGSSVVMLKCLLDIINQDCSDINYFTPVMKGKNKNSIVCIELVKQVEDYLNSKYTFLTLTEYKTIPKLEKCKNIINRTVMYKDLQQMCSFIDKKQFYKILSNISTIHNTTSIKNGILAKLK